MVVVGCDRRPVYLGVGAVLALALAAGEHVRLGAAHFRELVLPDGLLRHGLPDLF